MQRVALMCGGQGSQKPGFGGLTDLLRQFPSIEKNIRDLGNSVLRKKRMDELFLLCDSLDEGKIGRTDNTQPLLFLHSCMIGNIIGLGKRDKSVEFIDHGFTKELPPITCVLGHSLGEYAALVLSGSICIHQGLQLVEARGKAMQEEIQNIESFTMSALLLSQQTKNESKIQLVQQICNDAVKEVPGVCEIANINSLHQIVISGTTPTVTKAIEIGKSSTRKIIRRAIPLKVGAPFHCSLMEPVKEKLHSLLHATDFKEPSLPFISTINASRVTNPICIPGLLENHCTDSVRWKESLEYIEKEYQIDTVIELGLGKTLSSLSKQVLKNVSTISLGTNEEVFSFIEEHTQLQMQSP